MVKKIVIAGMAAAAVLGAGTAALAASGLSGSSASPASSAASSPASGPGKAGQANQRPGLKLARRALHATWVTRNGNSGFVTHDAIRGQVTAVSASSITVKAADDVSQTYAVTGDTKVHTRANKKDGTIGEVKSGDRVIVLGTGTSSLTATQILDGAN